MEKKYLQVVLLQQTILDLKLLMMIIKIKQKHQKSYYCLSVPEGTVFKKVGNNIKVEFANKNSYMSIGTMTSKSQIEKFYKHGYAFVDKTSVTYKYDDDNAKMTSDYKVTTKVKKNRF